MSLEILAVPFVRPPLRDWTQAQVLGRHDGFEAALAAVRDLAATTATTAPDLLVLSRPGPPWSTIADGRLVAWAQAAERLRLVRPAKNGRRLLCGWCGGAVAEVVGAAIRPVETLVRAGPDRERHGLPTWVIRRQVVRARTNRGIDDQLRSRQRRAMAPPDPHRLPHGPPRLYRDELDALEEDVAILECPACATKGERPAVSLVVPLLDIRLTDRRGSGTIDGASVR